MTLERYDTLSTDRGKLPALRAEPRAAAHLVITQGEGVGRQVNMKETPLIVGRSSDCDMRLLNRAVSRLHCRVWKDATGFWLRDLNSTNKTYLNDRSVVEARLKDGDFITVGGTVMQFSEKSEPANDASANLGDSLPGGSISVTNSVEVGGADLLTGLPTRRAFEEDIEREIARSRRHGRTFVLACVDIDNLSDINRDYGQAAGDEAIRQIARMIRAGLRVEDLAARVGADEISILLTEVGLDFGVPILQSIRSAAGNAEFSFGGKSFKSSISIGAALWDPSVDSKAELHARVQAELKRAKTGGKNQVCWR
jgi:diguanylate cyclase (GGDEF)-like protein